MTEPSDTKTPSKALEPSESVVDTLIYNLRECLRLANRNLMLSLQAAVICAVISLGKLLPGDGSEALP